MRALVQEHARSGVPLRAFAVAAGVPCSTLARLRARLRGDAASRLASVVVAQEEVAGIEIAVGDVAVRVARGATAQATARLVAVHRAGRAGRELGAEPCALRDPAESLRRIGGREARPAAQRMVGAEPPPDVRDLLDRQAARRARTGGGGASSRGRRNCDADSLNAPLAAASSGLFRAFTLREDPLHA